MSEEKLSHAEEKENNVPEVNEDGVPRPAPDPKNKIYTVICLAIFAVIYFGWGLIKDNFTMTYQLYLDSFDENSEAVILDEMGIDALPDGAELLYARLHRNYGETVLYACVSLPEGMTEDEDFPDSLIGFEYGDVVCDSRFTVYPYPDSRADYVYGDAYVSIEDPRISLMVYESSEGFKAVFQTSSADNAAGNIFSGCEKIKAAKG